jgi:hypothetical protein
MPNWGRFNGRRPHKAALVASKARGTRPGAFESCRLRSRQCQGPCCPDAKGKRADTLKRAYHRTRGPDRTASAGSPVR